MSSVATPVPGWFAGLAAGCDRLVHPSIADARERSRQARLVGQLLAGPILVAAAAMQMLPNHIGVAAALASVCLVLATGWLSAVTVIASGRTEIARPALVALAVACAALVAAAGGLASPFAILAAAPLIEVIWSGGRRGQAMAAALLSAGAVAGAAWLATSLPTDVVAVGPAHWLIPAAYLATLAARAATLMAHSATEEVVPETPIEELMSAAVLTLGANGDVTSARGPSRALFGVPADYLHGTGFFDRMHVADRVAYLCALADARSGSEKSLELRLRRPAGAGDAGGHDWFVVELKPSAMRDEVFAIIRDGTAIAALRTELAAARDDAESGETAKNRFLAIVSHELRTPLNAIIGFSDMMLTGMTGPMVEPKQQEYVGLIRESGHHLLSVVNAILDVSKVESGSYDLRPEPMMFSDAFETCRSMLSFQASAKGVRIDSAVSASAGELCADPRAVRQILINLVANAIKFTPAGGIVTIGARKLGSQLRFWVSDTGIGIAEEDLALLGKPFAQVRNDYTRQFEGTGLGLALVRGLVALHEGTMSIESAPGEGTVVTIGLPVDGPAQKRGPAPAETQPTVRSIEGYDHGARRKIA